MAGKRSKGTPVRKRKHNYVGNRAERAEAKIQAKLKVSLGQTVTGMEVSWITPRGDPSGLAGYYPSVMSLLSHPRAVTP